MRNLKKFLALILAFMMTFSLMVTVNAADTSKDFTDGVTEKFVEGVKVLNGMKVFRGYEDGSFNPKGEITRAEVAAIVYRLATGDYNDTQSHLYKDYVNFDDVHSTDWFAGYVNYCANAQWIEGYGNGKFGPNDKVTGYQAAAMILRAVGYGKNNEFKGASWQVQVANVTRSEGLLVNVDNTNYANTLNQAATRELIAEILFQAAQIPTVTWTMLNGYNKYTTPLGVNGELNPSLGEKNYGLTSRTGVVVGNQATGELDTRVSVAVDGVYRINNDADAILVDGNFNDNRMTYAYESTDAKADLDTNGRGSVALTFDYNTGLDLFGHKATVWYDNRTATDSETFGGVADTDSGFSTTYAVLDRSTLDKIVFATSTKTNGADTEPKETSVYTAAVAAGFTKNYAPAWKSDRFCQIGDNSADNAAVESKVGMYRVISNSANKAADVVISLNQEVAQITQRNTTIKNGEYIYLGTGSSQFGAVLDNANKGKILDTLLAPGSDKTLGDVVTVNEVVGTTQTGMTNDKASDNDNPRDLTSVTGTTFPSQFCMYETSKLEPAFTGTITTYSVDDTSDPTIVTKVTLSDGKSYDLSGITGAHIDNSDYLWDFDDNTHLISGVRTLTPSNANAGVTYSFYLDEVGRFIGVSSASEYSFLYTTFADYEIGGLGTGTISYYAYGVDWNGNIVKTNNQIDSIKVPVLNTIDNKYYPVKYSTANKNLANGYNRLPVTKKDQGTSVGGNRVAEGNNTAFMMDGNGNLSWYSEGAKDCGEWFLGWSNNNTPSGTWTITANDARNGFKRVYAASDLNDSTTNVDYLLTSDTKFIVVTGSGTSDLSVKTYKGLTELVAGGSSAEIVYNITGSGNCDNVYFITGEQRYGNVDTNANRTIDTVILSDTNLRQYGAQSLFFSEPDNKATGVKPANDEGLTHRLNQYKLFNNGEVGYYWIADDLSTGIDDLSGDPTATENANGTANKGDFYRLTPVGTVNGQPYYKADIVNGGTYNNVLVGCDVDKQYNYVTVNNVNTAEIDTKVFKVGDAVVAEAFGNNKTHIVGSGNPFPSGTNNIDSVLKLNNAVSMGKAGTSGTYYTVKVAYVYDGINVSCIYVTDITTTP